MKGNILGALSVAALVTAVPGHAGTYRDASLPINQRVEDLVSGMTLEEKAGQLFQPILIPGPDGTLNPGGMGSNGTEFMLKDQHLTHFNLIGSVNDAQGTAEYLSKSSNSKILTGMRVDLHAYRPCSDYCQGDTPRHPRHHIDRPEARLHGECWYGLLSRVVLAVARISRPCRSEIC